MKEKRYHVCGRYSSGIYFCDPNVSSDQLDKMMADNSILITQIGTSVIKEKKYKKTAKKIK